MVKLATWNIRELGTLIKQVEVRNLLVENKISVLGLLGTRVKAVNCEKVAKKVCDWNCANNYQYAYNGRIWILWDPKTVLVEVIDRGSNTYTQRFLFLILEFSCTVLTYMH